MVRVIATLLLVLQLKPVAAAAAACAMRLHPAAACEMVTPSRTAPAHDGSSHHAVPPGSSPPACDCPVAILCAASTALVVPSVTGTLVPSPTFRASVDAALGAPHTTEPVAPPVPPPNA